MIFIHKYYEEYNYNYNKEFPLEIFIINRKKKNVEKKQHANTSNYVKNNKKDIIFDGSEYFDIKKINDSTKKFEKIQDNYYYSYKYNTLNKNTETPNLFSKNIFDINKKNTQIDKINSEIIYIYYVLYNDFLNNKNNNCLDLYKEFKIFIKQNNYIEIIEKSNIKLSTLYKYMNKCYDLINFITDDIANKYKIIDLFSMLKINIETIYKLNEVCFSKLKDFLKQKYKQYIYDFNNNFNSNNILEKYDNLYIKKICSEIPISYIGSKRNIANKIISLIPFDDNIDKYVELFSGSLCISYIIKIMYPHINITCYENDRFLLNFYFILKNHYNEFILEMYNIMENLKKSNDKKFFLKNIINITNEKLIKNNFNNISLACYYYIINKISFRGTLNYDKENKINIAVNEKRIPMLLKFGDKHKKKLYNYSLFLNKINIININICENYNKILKELDKNTVLYLDPPYYDNNKNNKDRYIDLKNFLDNVFTIGCKWLKSNSCSGYIMELFSSYTNNILKTRNNISNLSRVELLISSF